jgi:Immunity protein 26
MKKIRRREGDIVRIDLGNGEWTFGRILPQTVFAFYDCFQCPDDDIARIVSSRVLFKVPVMGSAVTTGRWKVVGNAPLDLQFARPPSFFKQDALDKERYYIDEGEIERPATREECIGVERLAVWSAEHIEDRLRDWRAGRPNKWFESLKIK